MHYDEFGRLIDDNACHPDRLSPNELIVQLLRYMGVDDADLAYDADPVVCEQQILDMTVGNDNFLKFLKYLRA